MIGAVVACVSARGPAQPSEPSGAGAAQAPAASAAATPTPRPDGESGTAQPDSAAAGAPVKPAAGAGRGSQPATPGATATPTPPGAPSGSTTGNDTSGPLLLTTLPEAQQGTAGDTAGSHAGNVAPVPPSGGGSAAPPARRTDGTPPGRLTLSLVADSTAPVVRSLVTITILAASNSGVVDAPLHLIYDPARLRFVDASEGDYLSRDGTGTVFLVNGLSRPGDVVIGAGRSHRSVGATGSGTLCRVRFEVLARGAARVSIGEAMAWGDDGALLAVTGGSIDLSVP